ncbi:MAG TPA: cation:proton antiporter [Vicinamibacterales bacterium]|nr:cation:proton antiporter [Vicinamibacterales bacterium]
MEHQTTLLLTLALAFVAAFILGFAASKLKLPPMVGYLLAGIAIGPYTPGFSGDPVIAGQLAEIGVILLMFGVGLHFSMADLMAVKGIAVPGAVGQIVVATAMVVGLTTMWGWPLGAGLVLGLALSVASTVVVLRALDERRMIESANGRIAIAWLVVEDLAMVLTLVLLPALAELTGAHPAAGGHAAATGNIWLLVGITVGKVGLFLAIVAWAGPRVVPWMLQQAARTGSHELFTLAVLAISLGIAYGAAAFFGVSFALGAFCAGVVLSNSELSHRAAEESLPLQHAFSVVFFVSVGMLFDPSVLIREPLAVLSVLAVILVGKSIAAFLIVQLLGYPVSTALTISASLAQIGEFSFILATLGISLGMMPAEGRDLILAGAILSLTLNPLAFAVVTPLLNWIRRWRSLLVRFEGAQDLRLARLQSLLDANRTGGPASVLGDELISRWWVFAGLDHDKRAELLSLFTPRSARPGDRIIRKGDPADEVFFISSGTVEVGVRGRKIRLGPGDFFGEMALLTGEPRSADVTAIDYTQLFTLTKAGFEPFVARHPELRTRIDLVAVQRAEENVSTPRPAGSR